MVLYQPHLQITRRTPSLRRISNAKPPLHHLYVPKERVFVSTTTYNEKPNASGLTPDQTRALPERTIDPDGPEARIIRSLRELYSCRAQDVRPRPLASLSYTPSLILGLPRDHMRFMLMTQSSTTLLA